MLLSLTTFLAVSLGLAGLYSLLLDLFWRRRQLVRERVQGEFARAKGAPVRPSALFRQLDQPLPTLAAEALLGDAPPPLPELTLGSRWRMKLAQAVPDLTLGRLAGVALATAVVAGLGVGTVLGPAVGALAAATAAFAPFLYVHFRWRAQTEKLMNQLPDTFDLMARVIRAGHSVPQALQAVVDEFEAPIATEFAYCQEQQKLGLLPEVTFRELAQRTHVLELKIFVMAMLIQRQTGGNLTELLERLATLVRDRIRLRGHIKALTAEGRLQAVILLLLPPFMFGVMYAIYPAYARSLLDYPSIIAAMLVSMGLGAWWIHHIVNFDF